MMFARAALLLLVTVTPALGSASARETTSELRRDRAGAGFGSEGGQTAVAPSDPKAQALFEFLMARRMESEGDNAGALAALERARKLDPKSAEIAAEIAGHHSRQSRMPEAIAAAEQALKLDKDNVEAHHVLSLVYSAWADGVAPAPSGTSPAAARASAIEH